ncbi:MAG: tetratricopeptide repeat protein [Gammaproteobacteria bacterium]
MKSREARTVAACVAGCMAAWAAGPAAAVTDAERISANQQFREAFDAKRYADALPFAEKVVSLTEEQYGKDARALVNPLANLGTVHYRLRDYPAAEKDYQRSVDILEKTAGNADRQLLRPLQGLGASHFAENEYVDASVALKRAIDLSRNLDGLFNAEQLQILEPLISSYVALDLTAEAEKEQQYALRVAETAFGRTDARMLKPLDRYWAVAGADRSIHQRAPALCPRAHHCGADLRARLAGGGGSVARHRAQLPARVRERRGGSAQHAGRFLQPRPDRHLRRRAAPQSRR